MNSIKTKNLEIFSYFKFSDYSSNLELDDKKINFVYANNGAGKSTLGKYLNSIHEEDFYLIDINNNVYIQNSNEMIISKNILEFKNLENKIENTNNIFSREVKNIINKYNLSINSPIWKKLIKPYYILKGFDNLVSITNKNKKDIQNLKLDYNQIINLNSELNNFSIKFSKNLYTQLDSKQLLNNEFEDILELKKDIESKITNIEIEIKDQIIKEFKKTNIDVYILEEIYFLINGLDKMDKCYICNSNIQNFDDIKISMKKRIDELKNNFDSLFDLKDKLKKWDGIFNTGLVKEYIDHKFENIISITNQSYENLSNYLLNYFFDLKNMMNDVEKIKLINDLKNNIIKIQELKKERILKSINEEDFNVFKSIINNLVGEDRIKFNFKDNKFIEINLDNQNLPFSSGEIKIISFIFSLMYFISSVEDYKKRYIIVDDIDESFDNLNIINYVHVIKTFFYDYKIKFLILTHNNQLIKQVYDSGVKEINIFLIYKLITFERNLIKLNNKNINDEISYLGFKSGIQLLKNRISKELCNLNNNEKFIFIFIYTQWILRIINLISNDKDINKNYSPILILKYKHLFNNSNKEESANIFNEAKNEFKQFYNLDEKNNLLNISYDDFVKKIENIIKNSLLDLKIEFNNISYIMSTNITNIVKFIILREMIKLYLIKLNNDSKEVTDNESVRIILNKLYSTNIISLENKKKLNYLWNFLSTYCHIEINPSLLLSGIELNDFIVHRVIKDVFELIGKGENSSK